MVSRNDRTFWRWLYLQLLIKILPLRFLLFLNKVISTPHRGRSKVPVTGTTSLFDLADNLFDDSAVIQQKKIMPEPDFLSNGFFRSVQGGIAFKKQPNSILLPAYLDCQIEGVAYFDKVFRGVLDRHAPYGDIMATHHRILASGLDGQQSYPVGFSNQTSRDVAGKLRHSGGRVAFPVRGAKRVRALLQAFAEIRWSAAGQWHIETAGIPERAWSKAMCAKHGFDVVHPDGIYIPLYFTKMEACLNVFRSLMSQPDPMGPGHIKLLLQALATYFHLGIHAHAFVRINQSLLWSQVNYILMLNHFQPVCHGGMDLVAAFVSIGHFENYFSSYVFDCQSATSVSA